MALHGFEVGNDKIKLIKFNGILGHFLGICSPKYCFPICSIDIERTWVR